MNKDSAKEGLKKMLDDMMEDLQDDDGGERWGTLRGEIVVGNFAPGNFDFRITFTRYYNYKINTLNLTFYDWLKKYEPRINRSIVRNGTVSQINNLLLNSCDRIKLKDMLTHMNVRYSHLIGNFPKPMDYNQLPKELVSAFLVGYPSFCNSNFNNKKQYLDWLRNNNYAGTNNSASAIFDTGSSIGQFFNLLNKNNQPNDNYLDFFQPS